MVRLCMSVCFAFGVVFFSSVGWARPALPAPSVTRTSSSPDIVVTVTKTATTVEEAWSVLVLVEPEIMFEESNAIEQGILHPEAISIFVLMDTGLPWLSAFAHSRVGEGGESYAGLAFKPLSLFGVDPRAARLDFGLGVGMKALVPILPGWVLRLDVTDDLILFMKGHYQYITGWDQDLLLRFRIFPGGKWYTELWGGLSARVAGEDQLYKTLEAAPLLVLRVRWPIDFNISVGWPFRRIERRTEPRFRLGLEFEGHF